MGLINQMPITMALVYYRMRNSDKANRHYNRYQILIQQQSPEDPKSVAKKRPQLHLYLSDRSLQLEGRQLWQQQEQLLHPDDSASQTATSATTEC